MIERVNEVEETKKALVEIQIQLARIEKTLEAIPTLTTNLETARDLAREAMQSVKTAHHRLDKIEDNQKWLWRTFAGAIVLAVVTFIISGGLNL